MNVMIGGEASLMHHLVRVSAASMNRLEAGIDVVWMNEKKSACDLEKLIHRLFP